MIELRGITWDHPRGLAPLLATAAAYRQKHPEVRITWEARSLQAFGAQPVEELVRAYDLLVIDHPFTGAAARSGCIVALDTLLPPGVLAEQARQSVGPSDASYSYGGRQWALAIDAAAQVSAYRPDLLARAELPYTWAGVLALAREGRVAVPLTPVNAICSFLTLCASHGEPPGQAENRLVGYETGRTALEVLHGLAMHGHPADLTLDPPRLLDHMAANDEIAYCPLLFGYSNYARAGYAPCLIRFCDIPAAEEGGAPRGALLGGAGLAVSARCRALPQAADYAAWVAGADCQRTLYVQAGGQPGNRAAWTDPAANAATNDFFQGTLRTLDAAYLRPRYAGFVAFQEQAGAIIHAALRDHDDPRATLDRLDAAYRASRAKTTRGEPAQ